MTMDLEEIESLCFTCDIREFRVLRNSCKLKVDGEKLKVDESTINDCEIE
jgi:hypothetical protein